MRLDCFVEILKEKQEKNRGLLSIRSTMSNESGASFQLCSLGWKAMEEENEEITTLGMR